jgi:hypothetical protein
MKVTLRPTASRTGIQPFFATVPIVVLEKLLADWLMRSRRIYEGHDVIFPHPVLVYMEDPYRGR